MSVIKKLQKKRLTVMMSKILRCFAKELCKCEEQSLYYMGGSELNKMKFRKTLV